MGLEEAGNTERRRDEDDAEGGEGPDEKILCQLVQVKYKSS